MGEFLQDLRYGLRLLVRQRGVSAVVAGTLALAIGANTVIFSIASFLLLRPLPFQDRDTLVALFMVDTQRGADREAVSDADFLEWRRESGAFAGIGAFTRATYTLSGRGEPVRLAAQQVTAELLTLWGVAPATGRMFQSGDDAPGTAPVVLLSHGYWMRQFGGDPGMIGDSLVLDGVPHQVVGVVSPDLEIGSMSLIEVWTPLVLDPVAPRTERRLNAYGRLRPGVTVAEASAEIAAIARRQQQAHATTNEGWDARAIPLLEAMTGRNSWFVLGLLSLVVALVLVIACANVANLMLARSVVRRKELAVRAAIGAGRFRIVRQLVTESLLLGLLGGVLGLATAYGGLRVIRAVTFEPFFQQITIDARVLLYVATLSVLTPLIFGLLPALAAARLNLSQAIGEGAGRTSGGLQGRRSRNLLVVAQLSMATALLILSTLVIRAAVAESRFDPGFDPANLLTLRIELAGPRYPDDASAQRFAEATLARLSRLPGVEHAAVASALPVFSRVPPVTFSLESRGLEHPADRPWALSTTVSEDYFDAFDIPILRGRPFRDTDRSGDPGAVVISAETARRYWPDADPIGQRITLTDSDTPMTIVGIAGDVFNSDSLRDSFQPAIYLPLGQHPRRQLAFAIGTAVEPSTLVESVRREIRSEDPDQAVYDVRTMAQTFWENLASDRLIYGLFSSFALVALLLATAGLYGLMAYSVSQRSQEFGVRMALGAQARDVVRQVVRQGLGLAVLGLGLGLAGGFALASAVASQLYGVGPRDPLTYSVAAGTLLIVALLASWIPARRAAAQDPVRALRG